MARISPRSSIQGLLVLICLLSLFLRGCTADFYDLESGQEIHTRYRRATVNETVNVANPVPENVANDVTLYNLTGNYPGRYYQVMGNSAGVLDMFQTTGGRLTLTPTLPETTRKLFDYEKYKTFDVIVSATNATDATDVKILTIRLTLSDVNDEYPVFTNQPRPFVAKLQSLMNPGTVVYRVTVTDPDQNPNLSFGISSVLPAETPSRFQVNQAASTATEFTIVTVGNEAFNGDYTIGIFVVDTAGVGGEQRTTYQITARVANIAPQFYATSYKGRIYENMGTAMNRNWVNTADNGPLEIRVKQFQPGNTLTYRLLDNSDGLTSSLFEMVPDTTNSAIQKIQNIANIDYEKLKSAALTIRVTEAGTGLTSTAQITIDVVDENDHAPQFVRSQYSNTNLPEDTTPGQSILTVEATDADSGLNGELVFTLTNYNYFNITTAKSGSVYQGILTANGALDYDQSPGPRYNATVIVSDKGASPKTATMFVTIEVVNVNDNKPVFINSTTPVRLVETTPNGGFVTRIQATDIDGDTVKYYFQGRASTLEIFAMDSQEGTVTLNSALGIPLGKDTYTLPVIAVDDDNCCKNINKGQKTATSTLTINIIGVNANKPKFTNCATYDTTAKVKEKAPPGTTVIQVKADDPDRGDDGRVLYRIVSPDPNGANAEFQIDEDTGNITVKGTVIHGTEGYIQVTVVGRNPGNFPLLEGWCTFRVNIIDINDHAPEFAQLQYEATVSILTKPVSLIRQMEAKDQDVGVNANITYSLLGNDSATQIFNINATNGLILLVRDLNPATQYYMLTVVANDNGIDPGPLTGTTTVRITVNFENTQPPEWVNLQDPLQFSVSESASIGYLITTLRCDSRTTNPEVEYRVFNATDDITSDSANFRAQGFIRDGHSFVNLTVKAPLRAQQYRLSLVCQTLGAVAIPSLISPVINVQDANNEVPIFQGLGSNGRYQGQVAENAPAGQSVLTVTASDSDKVAPFNTVHFELVGENANFFQVRDLGGNKAEIQTTSALVLDRETTYYYNVKIKAMDGAPANPPNPDDPLAPNTAERFIDITVTDVNDNPPVFNKTLYTATVSEKAFVNSLVFVVTATDKDETDEGLGLRYQFGPGNYNNAFTILAGTGEVRVARNLDYENPLEPKVYRMTLTATDSPPQSHTATTSVEISVLDENDNRPIFTKAEYKVENVITEEDTSITPSNPRFLVQVKATDADVDRTQTAIRYSIIDATGQPGPNQLFTIESVSGNVSLIGVLDREAGPSPNYKITVKAEDERINPLISYADVVIVPIDINDNAPEFNPQFLKGSVNEETVPIYVVTLLASDKDAGENARVSYRISPTQPSPDYSASFSVAEDGRITTRGDPALLDREKIEQMFLRVEAYDHGTSSLSSTATVTISLTDRNDQSPYFQKALYSQSMSEAQTSGVVMSVPAIDLDSDPKNKLLKFELRGSIDNTQNFDVRTNGQNAEIFVAEPIDYETDPHFYTFDLYVTDGVAGHENTTKIEITVTDYNDNPPKFDVDEIKITMLEERPRGQFMANFNATDADSGINAEFEFSVVRSSDPRYEFYIDPQTGVVTTRKPLDREIEDVITVTFMAKDKGEIPLNSTARLIVTLIDINDNAPRFKDNYRPVVPENVDHNNLLVQEIFAYDPDTPKYGPPFGFKLPASCNVPACNFFTLTYNPGGDNDQGTATIRTISTTTRFDREATKYYYLPIIMQDMYGVTSNVSAETATNTLTIVIGDENDNPPEPGHQDIHIYNYEGQFGTIEIGRVYADDPDDWDLPDKTFTFIGPDSMKQFFRVDPNTGMITLNLTAGIGTNDESNPYELRVNVHDAKFDKTVLCTISVVVEALTDEAVRKSGGVRLQGITAEEFIKPRPSTTANGAPTSKYTLFRQQVATLLGYPSPDNVEIVSLTDGEGYLDVRFSGHASPYLNGAQMESSIMLSLAKFEQAVGVKVSQVPINLCMEEMYDDGCYTSLDVTGQPALINSNGTSVVSIGTYVTAHSGCVDSMFPEPVECRGDYCFNGGTCIKDDWGKLSCECPAGFDGPRCQQRRHNFDGTSAAFYKGLSVCSEGRTSIEFITDAEDGLIMFSGPINAIDPNTDPLDYLFLELEKGYPKLKINLGSQELELKVTGAKLSDGKWHHLDIDRLNQDVILTVDHCKSAVADANGTVSDWSPCRASGTVGGPDVLLNVQSLLQLGGRYPVSPPTYPTGVTNLGFRGCLRNLVHNTKLYDLHFKKPPAWNSGLNGCPKEESICGLDVAQPVCGQNSVCESQWQPQTYTCKCLPGFYGQLCATEAPIHDFKQSSYFKWQLPAPVIADTRRTASLQMLFRTRQTSGTLFALTNNDQKNILLQMKNGKLTLSYNMGEGSKMLTLNDAQANNGIWHFVRVERYGNEFILSLDGGEGRNYNYQTTVTTLNVLFELSPYVSAGAYVPAVAEAAGQVTDDLVNTCVQDIRINEQWLPLSRDENGGAGAGGTLTQLQGIVDYCNRSDCDDVTCQGDLVCYPLWERHQCRCPSGFIQQGASTCVSACLNYPCFNGGICSIVDGETVCACTSGWTGPTCAMAIVDTTDDAGMHPGIIAAIVIGILLLIILVVLIILFCMRKERGDKEKMVVDVDPDDDFIRENVMFYDEEGAGEEDHDAYDITLLQRPGMETSARPTMPGREDDIKRQNAPRLERPDGPRLDRPDVGSFIKDRIRDTEDDDPNGDSIRAYNFEGADSEAGSLSSLNTSSSGGSQDYDYLSDWGPKFAKLADMYGAGQNLEPES